MKQLLVLASVLLAFVAGCGGSTASVGRNDLLPTPPVVDSPRDSGLINGHALHSVSGIPTGVRLSWFSLDDSADAGSRIAGYHIYKSASPIADSALGDNSFWLEVAGESQVSQPAILGSEIVVDDFFAVTVGETWYYRLSSVADDGDESALSPEAAVTIAPFIVDLLLTTSAGVGGSVEIQGRNFGLLDPVNDKVEIPGVVWEDGVGFNPALLDAAITDWTATTITVTVPLGATVGKVQVTIDGITLGTPEDFENSDPYITDVDRLSASMLNPITLTGNNFGPNQDPTHRVVYNGTEVLSNLNYTAYSNTVITYSPLNLQDYSQHPATVRVDVVDSNVAFNVLVNAPPTANLNGIPVVGNVPLTLQFDATASLDPENDGSANNGITNFEWDFDGDGTFNETGNGEEAAQGDPRPQFTFITVGVYNPVVRVSDVELATDTATIVVDATMPPPTIFDDPAQPDPSEPGQVNNIPSPFYEVNLFFGLRFGDPLLEVEVDADYLEVVSGDPVASFGQNDPAQIYSTTDSPFAGDNPKIADTVWVNQGTPGNYFFALRVTDDNGRQAVFVYAKAVPLVPPLAVGVIQDDQGDPTSGVSESIFTALNNMGYQTMQLNSFNLTLGELDDFDAIIWGSDGPQGTVNPVNPFEWLSAGDLTLIRDFVDTGRSAIIISPPAGDAGADMFQDGNFNNNYQPFKAAGFRDGLGGDDLVPQDFTASTPHSIDLIQYVGMFADTSGTGLYVGCTMEIEWQDPFGLFDTVGAIRPGPLGTGNLYFGMFSLPGIVALDPPSLSTEHLLDNIVSGTVALQ